MVVISAGFNKTHVTTAAREAHEHGVLTMAITGAYPTRGVQRLARRLRVDTRGRMARLLERGEDIPDDRLRALAMPELLYEAARTIALLPQGDMAYHHACAASWRLYGRLAARELRRAGTGARIYQFRAGFGHASVAAARELGMHVLCDHAIVHPELLDELVANRGRSARLERRAGGTRRPDGLLPTEQAILEDIDRSDSILVNSDFVKETFLACGWPPDRVHVVYLGVDDNFLRGLGDAPRPRRRGSGRLRLLFAGRFERRKGADLICEALAELDAVDWELVIAGPVMPDIRERHARFLDDPRVRLLGTISRRELGREMLAAPVFVFPSYAEGSARAVFEALACGCFVITTANSGTIVEDGIHGSVVGPDDPEALRLAIVGADADRQRIAEIGARNAGLIAARYPQPAYGDALAALYRQLSGPAGASPSGVSAGGLQPRADHRTGGDVAVEPGSSAQRRVLTHGDRTDDDALGPDGGAIADVGTGSRAHRCSSRTRADGHAVEDPDVAADPGAAADDDRDRMRQDQTRTDVDGSLDVDRVLGDQERSPESEQEPRARVGEPNDHCRVKARVVDQAGKKHQGETAR
ncbi:MAG TPA: glycosyltransferase family 4 protein [Solirubrobacteraceae bacterium]